MTALGRDEGAGKFHDEMLNGGVLPLDLLDARTSSWIESLKTRVSR